jgi:hypothetical protein
MRDGGVCMQRSSARGLLLEGGGRLLGGFGLDLLDLCKKRAKGGRAK